MSQWVDTPNLFQRTTRRLIGTRPMAWLLSNSIHHIDRAVMQMSNGRTTAAAFFSGLPVVNVTTTGAKSGLPRTVPLVGVPDGDRLILIASNWGQSRHPGWYYNLIANPQVHVTYGGETRDYRARQVADAEREACWGRAVALYGGYRGYAARAGRQIPVMVLEPVSSVDGSYSSAAG